MHILIIEDDEWMADIVRRRIISLPEVASVDVAPNAIAAFDYLDARAPHCIVLDMLLDGPNGMTFLHELRSHSDTAPIPVVVFSSLDTVSESLLKPYGVVACIDKASAQLDDVATAVRRAYQGATCR